MDWFKPLPAPLLLLTAWGLGSWLGIFNDFLLPSPGRICKATVELYACGVLVPNITTSLLRVVVGFLLTLAVAFPLGILAGLNKSVQDYLNIPLEFMRNVPPLAVTPLLILWFGIGETSKLAVIMLSTFFPIFLNTASGVAHSDIKLIEVGRIMGFGHLRIICRIILPSSLPSILTGLRLGLGFSWRALIGAELLAAASGLGYMIIEAEQFARTDIVIVGILCIGTLGYTMDAAFRHISALILPWQKEFTAHAGH